MTAQEIQYELPAAIRVDEREVDDGRDLTVLNAGAPINDKQSMERLLRNLPDADALRPHLGTRFALRVYDDKAQREIWVSSDGEHIILNALEDVSAEESLCIGELCDALPDFNGRNPEAIVRLAAVALNLEVDRSVEPTVMLRKGLAF